MIKRSKLKQRIYDALSIYSNDEELRSTLTNVVFSNLDYADMEFAPEEPSAMETFEEMLSKSCDLGAYYNIEDIAAIGEKMRDELQARIVDLEKRIEEKDAELFSCRQSLLKQGIEKDAKIKQLKKPMPLYEEMAAKIKNLEDTKMRHNDWIRKAKNDASYQDNISFDIVWADALRALKLHQLPESPELVKARENYYDGTECKNTPAEQLIDALESEIARLRGGK
jgi:hypothetical protein